MVKAPDRSEGYAIDTRLVFRRCHVCEWEGELVERKSAAQPVEPSCPWCHAPTQLVGLFQPASLPGHKNPYAAALGRRGGLKGGPARAKALDARRRREIAVKAALARWRKR